MNDMNGKIVGLSQVVAIRQAAKRKRQKVAFTNGVFDILHVGHTRYLTAARRMGHLLVVGVNTDRSVRRIKGPKRPIVPQRERAEMMCALRCVDYVVLFDDETPFRLIKKLLPDVLVKGADWAKDDIVGHDIVEAAGGRVVRIRLARDKSTTNLIKKVLSAYRP